MDRRLQSMHIRTRTYFTALVVVLALIYAGFELHEARGFEANEAADRAQIADLHKRLGRSPTRAPQPTAAGVVSAAISRPAAPTPPQDFGLHAKRELSRDARLAWGRQILAEHPELRHQAVAINAAQFEIMYRDFFRERGNSDEQITALARRLAEETGMESFWSDYGNFFLPLTNLPESAAEQRKNAILRETLGDAGFTDFERFDHEWMSHARVQELAAMLFDTDRPLTKPEAQQMEAVFNREVGPRDSIKPQQWDAIIQEAGSVLSPAQLDALRLQYRQATVGVVK